MRLIGWFAVLALVVSCASQHRSPMTQRAYEEAKNSDPSCQPLTDSDRQTIIELADPENFPNSKYRKKIRVPSAIEKETDCSRFVHEIYRRAGMPYAFRSSTEMRDAPEFDLLEEKQAEPGDIMLFRKHMGIVGQDGLIISATRMRKRKTTISRMDRANFPGQRGQRYVLRYRCRPSQAVKP